MALRFIRNHQRFANGVLALSKDIMVGSINWNIGNSPKDEKKDWIYSLSMGASRTQFNYGYSPSMEDAQVALQKAFDDWCEAAGLVEK